MSCSAVTCETITNLSIHNNIYFIHSDILVSSAKSEIATGDSSHCLCFHDLIDNQNPPIL